MRQIGTNQKFKDEFCYNIRTPCSWMLEKLSSIPTVEWLFSKISMVE